jgi:hypothetical protein
MVIEPTAGSRVAGLAAIEKFYVDLLSRWRRPNDGCGRWDVGEFERRSNPILSEGGSSRFSHPTSAI